MTHETLTRRACLALVAFALVGCGGDSTGPSVTLTEEQVADMMDAMTAVNALGGVATTQMTVVNVSQTVDCPNGGTYSVSGSVNDNSGSGSATIHVTQGFNGCKATSKQGRVWTFNGMPNIATDISMTANQQTQAFSITGTQVGGITFSSDLGSGSCGINLTIALSGDADSFEGSINGTACGHTIQQSMSVAP